MAKDLRTYTADHTLVRGDEQVIVQLDSASPLTLTVPKNSNEAIPLSAVIDVRNLGAGAVTITGDSGVTVNGTSLELAQYAEGKLQKIGEDEWIFSAAGGSGTPTTVTDYQEKITLTDAQIKALPTTPLQIAAAPGVGKFIFTHNIVYKMNFAAVYTLSDGSPLTAASDIVLAYGNNEYNAVRPIPANDSLGNVQTNNLWFWSGITNQNTTFNSFAAQNDCENKLLAICSDSENGQNYIGGDPSNTLEVTVFYSIVDL